MRAIVFVGQSLDGYIARSDGSLDFLDVPGANEDHGFAAVMDSVDAMVMGRDTFDFVERYGAWPFGDKPVFVLSHRPVDDPPRTVEVLDLPPRGVADELDRRGIDRVYVDGGRTIQSFLDAGLVERLIITTVPVLIGSGIPLFGATTADIALRLVGLTSFGGGLTQATYDVV
jgi:dihydrofolate reductase